MQSESFATLRAGTNASSIHSNLEKLRSKTWRFWKPGLLFKKAMKLFTYLNYGGNCRQAFEFYMPIQETFFVFRFAMLRDSFGTSWMILCERPRPEGTIS